MAETNNEELIKKLAESRENINLLQNMLKKEQWNMERELQIIGGAKRNLDEALYGLTCDEFYLNT